MKNCSADIDTLLEGLDFRETVKTSLKRLIWEASKTHTGNKPQGKELSRLFEVFMDELLEASAVIHCSIDWSTNMRKKYNFLLRDQARRLESMGMILNELLKSYREKKE